jgi:hypothetical protein
MNTSNKKRKIEQTENQYEYIGVDPLKENENEQSNFLTHTALSFRENQEEDLGSYVTDSSGMFLHKSKLMQAIINKNMEVEFKFVRELAYDELKTIEHMGDLFPKAVIKGTTIDKLN